MDLIVAPFSDRKSMPFSRAVSRYPCLTDVEKLGSQCERFLGPKSMIKRKGGICETLFSSMTNVVFEGSGLQARSQN